MLDVNLYLVLTTKCVYTIWKTLQYILDTKVIIVCKGTEKHNFEYEKVLRKNILNICISIYNTLKNYNYVL